MTTKRAARMTREQEDAARRLQDAETQAAAVRALDRDREHARKSAGRADQMKAAYLARQKVCGPDCTLPQAEPGEGHSALHYRRLQAAAD